MLVMTLLIAGAYFASFYAPMLSTSSENAYAARPIKTTNTTGARTSPCPNGTRCRRWRRKQTSRSPPGRNRARPYWARTAPTTIETDTGFGTTYTTAYAKLLHGATFFSESAYNALTGQDVDIPAGAYAANILDDEGGSGYLSGGDATHLTNMATGAELDVTPIEPLRYTMLLGCYVLDDMD